MADPTPAELMRAQGHLVAFLASLFQRRGVVKRAEFSSLLQTYADLVAETDPAEGAILAAWAAVVRQMTPSGR